MRNESTARLPVSATECEAKLVVEKFDREQGDVLYRVICKQCRRAFDAQGCMEIYQLVLIAFWKVVKRRIEAGTYVHESPIRLAIGIARRVIRNAKRTHRRKACQSLPNELAAVGDVATICDEDFKRHLIAAFATLTPIQRRVVDAYLAYVDQSGKLRGGRYQQMADDLGLRPDVVRSIFRRGIAKIRWYFQFAAKHRA